MFKQLPRIPLIVLAMLALLAALWAGLIRMGWELPPIQPMLPLAHGPLMVGGFLGVVIALERAVALAIPVKGQRRLLWPYLSPICTGLGALALIIGQTEIGSLLLTLGSLVLCGVFLVIIRRQPALFTGMMGAGAFAWLVGNALWLSGQPIPYVVLWWIGFPTLTIVGERLELSRMMRLPPASRITFLIGTGIFILGAVIAAFDFGSGVRVAGIGEVALAIWLFRYDIARRTVLRPGLTRFIALCLLLGYFWLAFGGAAQIVLGGVVAGPFYDAMLHALFVGFTFSMIFGHAPIILPAVLGVPIAFRNVFYAHLILLHLSLMLRMVGNLALLPAVRQWGGMFNVIALLLFVGSTARAVWVTRKAVTPTIPQPARNVKMHQPERS
ncbi:MAG: hypothetical protein IT324_14190 [Anaerolineae bacterium]|nr:hypothetical protein [Anaerolineae bacterium]